MSGDGNSAFPGSDDHSCILAIFTFYRLYRYDLLRIAGTVEEVSLPIPELMSAKGDEATIHTCTWLVNWGYNFQRNYDRELNLKGYQSSQDVDGIGVT